MQLLYFCLLLSAVAMPILPSLLQDDFLHTVAVSTVRQLPTDFHHFHPSRVQPIESVVGMLILVAVFGIISKFIESRLNAALITGALPSEVAETHMIHKRLLQWSWVLMSPFFLAIIGWGTMPEKLIPRFSGLGWSLLIWMLPTVLMVVLIDSQSHRWRNMLVASVASRRDDTNMESWIRTFWSHARQTWLVVFAMPLVACFAIDLATATSNFWEINATIKSLLCVFVMMPIVFAMPYAMLWCWSTEKLEGIDDDLSSISNKRVAWIRELWKHHVPRSPQILFWSTNNRVACAMVVGWLPPLRCLVLSDALLQKLNNDQLRMVILHEVAHVRRGHVWLRFVPVMVGTVGLSLWFQPSTYAIILQSVPGYAIWTHALATLGGILALVCWISSVAKWTELDADRIAIKISDLHKSEADSKNFVQHYLREQNSTQKLENTANTDPTDHSWYAGRPRTPAADMIQALLKIVPKSHHHAGGWLHPSLKTRRLRIEQTYFMRFTSMVESIDNVLKAPVPSDPPSFSASNPITCHVGN
ncbi:MAG: M48 family metalloprotease [Planctomycetota bacterium]|nr:M48 family metalloprotease [Planctomycetota bacterium]